MLQYYTLEQAAKLLGMASDEAKAVLDKHKVRPYRDGSSTRYLASNVEEVARALGMGSDPGLQLGEAPKPKAPNTPAPRPTTASATGDPGVFDFHLDVEEENAHTELDQQPAARPGDSHKTGRSSSKLASPPAAGPKASEDDSDQVELGQQAPAKPGDSRKTGRSSSKKGGAPVQILKPSSDSDVRLVSDGSDLNYPVTPNKAKKSNEPPSSRSGKRKQSPPVEDVDQGETTVHIVGLGAAPDSDVRVYSDVADEGSVSLGDQIGRQHSDSDIHLEEAEPPPRVDEGSDESLVTEEIDLDAEERKAEEAARSKGKKKRPTLAPPSPPTISPFELSESDLNLPPAGKAASPASAEDSSDFELTPAAAESSPIEPSSDELARVAPSDEEVSLGEVTAGGAGSSGINVSEPADSGISLEGNGSSDSVEMELSAGDAEASAEPAPAAEEESSSEFELSLEDSGGEQPAASSESSSDSEFELSLEDSSGEQSAVQSDSSSESEFELSLEDSATGAAPAAAEPDSDSEFELTLDDSGGLVPLEKDAEGQDIFETDFEVPALDDESGSEAVALDDADTDLESSEFDLALGDEDVADDAESGSQVVALEDEDAADSAARTMARRGKRRAPVGVEEGEVDELLEADEREEAAAEVGEGEEETVSPRLAAAAPAAPWGALPAVFLLPCVVVLLIAGLMGYELIHGMWGYQQPSKVSGFLTDEVARWFYPDDLPKR
jgi:hypothetical protein